MQGQHLQARAVIQRGRYRSSELIIMQVQLLEACAAAKRSWDGACQVVAPEAQHSRRGTCSEHIGNGPGEARIAVQLQLA